MRKFLLGHQPGENVPAAGHFTGRAEEDLRPVDSHEFLGRIIVAAAVPWSDGLSVRSKMINRADPSQAEATEPVVGFPLLLIL
ncbi:hypothetical protein ADIAG_02987 [Paeniglutamicibacter gangotriensis Lz1y]|uniref:Uncharacterized protein n=1 Tax=Paeniglutamicibacter gangotriensis Lz1y TaxID=1276920 RepID=M7MMM5_9MICC|nr:hypothetical protein ADIAG_02987 [Paeniglutamicibacter gangotriensis Lz1y]